MEDSLKKRYIIKLFASLISGIVTLIIISIVPKALGPIAFGQFSYIQQFFIQFMAFLDAGTSTAFFTKLSANNLRKELIGFYFFFSLFLLIIASILLFSIDILSLTSYLLPDIEAKYIYFGLYFGFFTWLTQVYIKISDSYALTVSVELVKIVHKLFSLLLLYFFINYINFDLSMYFYFHLISLFSFLFIISILFVQKNIFTQHIFLFQKKLKKLIIEFYIYSSPLFVFNIIAISVAFFDIWLLQKIGGSVQTGYYGLAYSIAAICFLFTSAMTPIITREFSKFHAINDMNSIKVLFKRYIPMLYSISAYFGVFIAFQSERLLYFFTDEQFKNAYLVLVIMAFYPIHQTYGQLNGSLFLSMGKTKLYKNIGIVVSVFGLVLSCIFIYFLDLGAKGFALKMILIQIIGVNIQLYFNTKELKLKILPFFKHQFLSILFFISIAFLSTNIFDLNGYGIYSFLFYGIIYTSFTMIGLFIFPSLFSLTRNEIKEFLTNLKTRSKI